MNKINAIIVKDGTVNLKRSLFFDPIWDSFSVSYVAYIPQKYTICNNNKNRDRN